MDLEGTIAELRVIKLIYSLETSIRLSRVMILGVDIYSGVIILDESY